MRWRKLGLVYRPDGFAPWARSHAMIPTPVRLNDEVIRVFVTFCDADGRGRPAYVDVSAADPSNVLGVSERPILDLGAPGTFDENGVLACSVVYLGDGKFHMYYAGFELGTQIRYRLLTGLATSHDGGKTFTRASTTPVLERSEEELYFRGGPYCVVDPAGGFRLWYAAGSHWIDLSGKQMPVYDIRYAESSDGKLWPATGEVVIPVRYEDEHGFGRPAVIAKPGGGYRMFYSIRRKSFEAYRLGYAESADGRVWKRMDDVLQLDVSETGFDSDAIMYAAPIEVGGDLYVFYNGNNFGEEGFAVALLEKE